MTEPSPFDSSQWTQLNLFWSGYPRFGPAFHSYSCTHSGYGIGSTSTSFRAVLGFVVIKIGTSQNASKLQYQAYRPHRYAADEHIRTVYKFPKKGYTTLRTPINLTLLYLLLSFPMQFLGRFLTVCCTYTQQVSKSMYIVFPSTFLQVLSTHFCSCASIYVNIFYDISFGSRSCHSSQKLLGTPVHTVIGDCVFSNPGSIDFNVCMQIVDVYVYGAWDIEGFACHVEFQQQVGQHTKSSFNFQGLLYALVLHLYVHSLLFFPLYLFYCILMIFIAL